MSADSTFGALEVDQQIVRMLGQMLQSEAVYSDPELVEQAGKLLDVVPDVQDEFLHQTPSEGGVLYRAVDVKFSKTLKKLLLFEKDGCLISKAVQKICLLSKQISASVLA